MRSNNKIYCDIVVMIELCILVFPLYGIAHV